VPDQELADYIRSLPYYQKDGKFNSEMYAKVPNPGIEETRQRERLQLAKFRNYLIERIRLTPAESRQAFELKETKVDLEFAKIDFNQLASAEKPSAKEVADFTKTAKETDFSQYYDAHKKEFTDKAKVHLKQIRVGVPYQAKAEQKAEAKKKIVEIAKLVTPDTFAKIAQEKSDDEYAKKGGDAGWIARGTLEPTLESAIDALQPGQVSQPIETPFGYFVLLATESKPETVHTLDEVKPKIAEKLVAEQKQKTFADARKAEWEKVLAEGKPLEPELKKFKVEMKKTGPFSIGQGSIPSIGAAEPIVDAVFNLTLKDPVAKKLLPFGGAYYYVKLKSVDRPKQTEYVKNRESVERDVETQLQTELLTKWVANLEKSATIKTDLKF
jgi:peptidyl-prolyl cis-trans isomerase D